MKISIFINGDGFEMREALALAKQLTEANYEVETYDWDASETESLAKIYDIYSTPSVLITTDTGGFVELWQGEVPTVSEVKYRMGS